MGRKVLIVDDKEQIAKIVSASLAGEYDCFYHPTPLEAMEWMRGGNTPDLIISDIRMPAMRGDEFLDLLKRDPTLHGIPVIMLSSEDSTSERMRLLENGAADYIVKPFNPLELRMRIRKILQ